MRFIVITEPQFVNNEAAVITRLLRWGVDFVHIRKPESAATDVENLIKAIPTEYHRRLVLHDHFDLFAHFTLHGLHLNRRNSVLPRGFKGSVSHSCHTLKEVEYYKPMCDYVFLSPIFNSISKQGYASAFTPQALLEAKRQGIIDKKVFALGGITACNIEETKHYGFGGVALLGDVWNRIGDADFEAYIRRIAHLC
uniref:Thiamine phosphate synthase n=2 Tax=unclassified Prevotella TaxID=2638335 RepID=A0AB33J256_9BACT